MSGEEWLLVSGSGAGNGETSYASKISLEGTILLSSLYSDYTSPPGTYRSSEQTNEKSAFKSEFSVVDGEWQSRFTGKDRSMIWRYYDTSASGEHTFTYDSSGGFGVPQLITETHENAFTGTLNHLTFETTEWERENGVRTDLRNDVWIFSHEVNSRHYFIDALSPAFDQKNSSDSRQTLVMSEHTVKLPGQSAVTTYNGFGTSSGERSSITSVWSEEQGYKGRIFRDSQTGELSGKSVATTTSSSYPLLPESHGPLAIDYNYFTLYRNGVDIRPSASRVAAMDYSVVYLLNCIIPSHQSHHNVVNVTYGTNGAGASVTFGEALDIPEYTFDSGISQYIQKQQPKYVQPDTSGVTPVNPKGWKITDPVRVGYDGDLGKSNQRQIYYQRFNGYTPFKTLYCTYNIY